VLLEIRWHGRAGQGVKTAAYLLAEAAMDTVSTYKLSRIWR